jgi:Ca-activated chloride channel homolog
MLRVENPWSRRGPSLGLSSLKAYRGLPRTARLRWLRAPLFLRIAAILLICGAMTRPRTGAQRVRNMGNGVAIQILIDRSGSMGSDFREGSEWTTALEAAKKLAVAFVQRRGSDLIGVTAFSRYPRTVSPLTFDHDSVVRRISQVEIAGHDEDGSPIGDALALAAARLKSADLGRATRVIILFTDGGINGGRRRIADAATLVATWGIRVHVVHFGGTLPPKKFLLRKNGVTMLETDAETQLQDLSTATGGTYRDTKSMDSLNAAIRAINSLEKTELPNVRTAGGREWFPHFLIAAFGLLVAEVFLNNLWLRRIP